MTNEQVVKWNLIAFCAIYLIFELMLTVSTQDPSSAGRSAGVAAAMQYLISWWIVKPQIKKRDKSSLIKFTWAVSFSVFVVRLLLSFVFVGLLLVA